MAAASTGVPARDPFDRDADLGAVARAEDRDAEPLADMHHATDPLPASERSASQNVRERLSDRAGVRDGGRARPGQGTHGRAHDDAVVEETPQGERPGPGRPADDERTAAEPDRRPHRPCEVDRPAAAIGLLVDNVARARQPAFPAGGGRENTGERVQIGRGGQVDPERSMLVAPNGHRVLPATDHRAVALEQVEDREVGLRPPVGDPLDRDPSSGDSRGRPEVRGRRGIARNAERRPVELLLARDGVSVPARPRHPNPAGPQDRQVASTYGSETRGPTTRTTESGLRLGSTSRSAETYCELSEPSDVHRPSVDGPRTRNGSVRPRRRAPRSSRRVVEGSRAERPSGGRAVGPYHERDRAVRKRREGADEPQRRSGLAAIDPNGRDAREPFGEGATTQPSRSASTREPRICRAPAVPDRVVGDQRRFDPVGAACQVGGHERPVSVTLRGGSTQRSVTGPGFTRTDAHRRTPDGRGPGRCEPERPSRPADGGRQASTASIRSRGATAAKAGPSPEAPEPRAPSRATASRYAAYGYPIARSTSSELSPIAVHHSPRSAASAAWAASGSSAANRLRTRATAGGSRGDPESDLQVGLQRGAADQFVRVVVGNDHFVGEARERVVERARGAHPDLARDLGRVARDLCDRGRDPGRPGPRRGSSRCLPRSNS